MIDYLEYLYEEYGDRFLLVYLSPRGAGPAEDSLPKQELPRWRGRFAVMPYWVDPGGAEREAENAGDEDNLREDVFADCRTGFSLAEWFSSCRARCEADRLRWFLGDAKAFCRQQFGGHSMTTDSETQVIRDHLFSNPERLKTAMAIHDAWPAVKAEVCEGFLEHLRARIHGRVANELSGMASDIRVEWKYDGQKRYANFLWLSRASWSPWENRNKKHPPYEGCTAVAMEAFGEGPNGWVCGVLHPLSKGSMTDSDKKHRTSLEEGLRHRFGGGVSDGGWWAYRRSVDGDKVNWDSLFVDLYREWKDGGGPIADYYVDSMMDIATKAIPAIDEVERTRSIPVR